MDILFLQWGWITPGTGNMNRHEQSDKHFEFLAEAISPEREHFLITHCGWWIDKNASDFVRALTGRNPESNRSLVPCDGNTWMKLQRQIRSGRLEFVVYPYAACVAEGTTGEGLLRSLRISRELAEELTGKPPRSVLNHDFMYGLEWAAVQMPQIAEILGFQILFSMHDGLIRSPDGTTVKTLGRIRLKAISGGDEPVGEIPVFNPLELTNNLYFIHNWPQIRESSPHLKGMELHAITMDEYLGRIRSRRIFDSRKMGSKSWYGGTIDSLLLEQNVRTVEIRLPAVEAVGVLNGNMTRKSRNLLDDLWKACFILCDNHLLWQCHNYKPHYLPASHDLAISAEELESGLLGGTPDSVESKDVIFNPTPWRRDLVVAADKHTFLAKNVPGWGTANVDCLKKSRPRINDTDPLTFSNGMAKFRLNELGQVAEVKHGRKTELFNGLGKLMRIHETPLGKRVVLKAGQKLESFEGALAISYEAGIPASCGAEVRFEMRGLAGAAFLLQVERLDSDGNCGESEWIPLQNLHWGGKGLPRHGCDIDPLAIQVKNARRLRLRIWMLAEGTVCPGAATLAFDGSRKLTVQSWDAELFYANTYSCPTTAEARILRNDPAMKTVRFNGELPDLKYQMDASLRAGSRHLEYDLRIFFPKPTTLGLSSPPFTTEDGSMLGAQCERPYVPGLAVLFPLSGPARYFSDQPFQIREMLQPSDLTWHTDVRNWWVGMSPFIGINMAVANEDMRQVGLLTRGLKHFFRWNREGAETLGLSLGASLIHQMTQGHSAPPESRLYQTIKRTDHDPIYETPFLQADGEYRFHYAVSVAGKGEKARHQLWKQAMEFALPPGLAHLPTNRMPSKSIVTAPESLIATALEQDGSRIRMRVVNMSSKAVHGFVRLPFKIRTAKCREALNHLKIAGSELEIGLPRWALREFIIQ